MVWHQSALSQGQSETTKNSIGTCATLEDLTEMKEYEVFVQKPVTKDMK